MNEWMDLGMLDADETVVGDEVEEKFGEAGGEVCGMI